MEIKILKLVNCFIILYNNILILSTSILTLLKALMAKVLRARQCNMMSSENNTRIDNTNGGDRYVTVNNIPTIEQDKINAKKYFNIIVFYT